MMTYKKWVNDHVDLNRTGNRDHKLPFRAIYLLFWKYIVECQPSQFVRNASYSSSRRREGRVDPLLLLDYRYSSRARVFNTLSICYN